MNPSSLVVHACLVFCFVGCNGQDVLAQLTLDQAVARLAALPKLDKPLDLWPLPPAHMQHAGLVKAVSDRLGALTLRPEQVASGAVAIPPPGIRYSLMEQPQFRAPTFGTATSATVDAMLAQSFVVLGQVERKCRQAGNWPERVWVDYEWPTPSGWTAEAWRSETIRAQRLLDGVYDQFFPHAGRSWYSAGQTNGQHVPVFVGTLRGIVAYEPDRLSVQDSVLLVNDAATPCGLWFSLRFSNTAGWRAAPSPQTTWQHGGRFGGLFSSKVAAQPAWNGVAAGLLYDHRDPSIDGASHPNLWCCDLTDPALWSQLDPFIRGAAGAP